MPGGLSLRKGGPKEPLLAATETMWCCFPSPMRGVCGSRYRCRVRGFGFPCSRRRPGGHHTGRTVSSRALGRSCSRLPPVCLMRHPTPPTRRDAQVSPTRRKANPLAGTHHKHTRKSGRLAGGSHAPEAPARAPPHPRGALSPSRKRGAVSDELDSPETADSYRPRSTPSATVSWIKRSAGAVRAGCFGVVRAVSGPESSRCRAALSRCRAATGPPSQRFRPPSAPLPQSLTRTRSARPSGAAENRTSGTAPTSTSTSALASASRIGADQASSRTRTWS